MGRRFGCILWHAVTILLISRSLTKAKSDYCQVHVSTYEQARACDLCFTIMLTAQGPSLSLCLSACWWLHFFPKWMCWGSVVPALKTMLVPSSSHAYWIQTKGVCEKHDLLLAITASAFSKAVQQYQTQSKQRSIEYSSSPSDNVENQIWTEINMQKFMGDHPNEGLLPCSSETGTCIKVHLKPKGFPRLSP